MLAELVRTTALLVSKCRRREMYMMAKLEDTELARGLLAIPDRRTSAVISRSRVIRVVYDVEGCF